MSFSSRHKNLPSSQSPRTRSHEQQMVSPSHHNTRLSSQNHARNHAASSSHSTDCNRGINGSHHRSSHNGIVNSTDKSSINCKSYTPLTVTLPNGCSSRMSVDSSENSINSFDTANPLSSPQPTFNGLIQISAPAAAANSSSVSSPSVYKSTNGHASTSKCSRNLANETAESTVEQVESSVNLDNLLQQFEKPTSIYRYLAALRKAKISLPIFLQRNLSYMKERGTKKASFKRCRRIDDIVNKLTKELKSKKRQPFAPISIKLYFLDDRLLAANFNGNSKPSSTATVTVEIIHKFTSGPDEHCILCDGHTLPLKSPNVPSSPSTVTRVNTRNDNSRIIMPTINISKDDFPLDHPNYIKSHVVFTVKVKSCSSNNPSPNTRSSSSNASNSNTLSPRDSDSKKRKRSLALSPSSSNGMSQLTSPRRDSSSSVTCTFSAEVPVINEHHQLALPTGNYELPMYRSSKNSSSSITNGTNRIHYGSENFDCETKLHFECIQGKTSASPAAQKSPTNRSCKSSPVSPCVSGKKIDSQQSVHLNGNTSSNDKPAVKIIYRFFVNQTNFQGTESYTNLSCPWCHISCCKLKQLAAHLKNCHERFNFRVRSESKSHPKMLEAIVDVVPNDSYDGSYSGNPYELSFSSTVGFAFARNGPLRRNPTTTLLVNKRGKCDFNDPNKRDSYEDLYDADIDTCRPTVFGHDRLYYHSHTCLPIRPQDMDDDSESEADPEWMRKRTQQVSFFASFLLSLETCICYS